jgi:transposase
MIEMGKTGVKRRRHSEEFKREAVQLVTGKGYSVAEAARSLGIAENLLRVWKKKYGLEGKETGTSLTSTEREELGRLRKENARLLMEREILKKATAFFAKEAP